VISPWGKLFMEKDAMMSISATDLQLSFILFLFRREGGFEIIFMGCLIFICFPDQVPGVLGGGIAIQGAHAFQLPWVIENKRVIYPLLVGKSVMTGREYGLVSYHISPIFGSKILLLS